MSEQSQRVTQAIRELVMANRILGNEGVLDALGHVSLRHPEEASCYLLSCSRSPALVSEDDIMEFDLDSNPLDQRGRTMYAERAIHGSIYRARPDVQTVCHSHARPLLPFTVTGVPLKPVWVMGAVIGEEVPLWDIREDFPQEEGMLIVNNEIGFSLAKRLGEGRTCLLASHGAVIVEATIKRVVQVAISLVTNAELFMQARLLAGTQEVRALRLLSGGEIRAMTELLFSPRALERMWEYWATRAGYGEGEAAH
jgi:HCOMODA/2-hydroxy-3-carboxy-muconic semialdehyde decarboxylase